MNNTLRKKVECYPYQKLVHHRKAAAFEEWFKAFLKGERHPQSIRTRRNRRRGSRLVCLIERLKSNRAMRHDLPF